MEIFLWAAFFCPARKIFRDWPGFFVVFNARHVIIFLKTSASFIYLQKQRCSWEKLMDSRSSEFSRFTERAPLDDERSMCEWHPSWFWTLENSAAKTERAVATKPPAMIPPEQIEMWTNELSSCRLKLYTMFSLLNLRHNILMWTLVVHTRLVKICKSFVVSSEEDPTTVTWSNVLVTSLSQEIFVFGLCWM